MATATSRWQFFFLSPSLPCDFRPFARSGGRGRIPRDPGEASLSPRPHIRGAAASGHGAAPRGEARRVGPLSERGDRRCRRRCSAGRALGPSTRTARPPSVAAVPRGEAVPGVCLLSSPRRSVAPGPTSVGREAARARRRSGQRRRLQGGIPQAPSPPACPSPLDGAPEGRVRVGRSREPSRVARRGCLRLRPIGRAGTRRCRRPRALGPTLVV